MRDSVKRFKKALLYAEHREDTTTDVIIMLCRLRSLAAMKQGSAIKQKTMKVFSNICKFRRNYVLYCTDFVIILQ